MNLRLRHPRTLDLLPGRRKKGFQRIALIGSVVSHCAGKSQFSKSNRPDE
jgi:hypothetical protein